MKRSFDFLLILFRPSGLCRPGPQRGPGEYWIYEGFYPASASQGKLIKRVPSFMPSYLTPFGLAIWIQEDGSRQLGQGVNLATNCFTHNECLFLAQILSSRFA